MSDVVSGLTVNRWRRYGKDRLYVSEADGETKIGWWDLVTDEGHAATPELEDTLLLAVEGWKADTLRGSKAGAVKDATTDGRAAESVVQLSTDAQFLAPEPVATVEAAGAPPVTVSPAHGTEPVPRPWIDLATNRPGAEAREQALAARDAAPVRTFLERALGVRNDERGWRIGADGEEKVAVQLAKVARKDPRWRFLHAIPVGDRGSDIDHLAIGPGGVFTLNAKHHPGAKIWVGGDTFMLNGNRQPYIRNSRHEAARAAKILTAACGFPVYVEGVVVTVNADDITIKKQPTGVHVVPRMQVARWLRRHGDVLTGDALHAIFEAARRSTTWRG